MKSARIASFSSMVRRHCAGLAKPRRANRLFAMEPLEERRVLDGLPIISEFLADNDNSLVDSLGRAEDWIEIFNSGDESIDLQGWYLTDDARQLTKWSFPSSELAANERIVVFASGCRFPGFECADPSVELHTNFRLDANGGYLALVQPDQRTIVSEFGSAETDYARQFEDISYGVQERAESIDLISRNSTIETFVPRDDSLATSWTDVGFDSSAWAQGQGSVGYDTSTGAATTHQLRLDFNDDDAGEAGAANTEDGFTGFTAADSGSTVNGIRVTITAIGEARLDDRDRSEPTDAPPAFTYDQIYDDFIFANRTFGSPGLRIELDGLAANQAYDAVFRSYDVSSTGTRVSTWTETLSGQTIVENFSFDGSDAPTDNQSHLFSASLVSSADGRLVIEGIRTGGTSHGVFLNSLELSAPGIGGLIQTNLQDVMYGQSSTLLTRIPFPVEEQSPYESLALSMQYDAGFVAYLNGTEVLRQNAAGAPGAPPSYDATATIERPLSETLTSQTFDLSQYIRLLRLGETNVLAIHGLNSSIDDGDFLLLPRLTATLPAGVALKYFSPATPGATNATGYSGVVRDTSFSHDRGFYDQPFEVQIATDTIGATIIYTVDGSPPSLTNGVQVQAAFGGPAVATVPIATTTHLRALAAKEGFVSTNIDTHTYVFLEDVIRQDPLQDPDAPDYPLRWQANAEADFEMDPEVVAQWDDQNPGNHDFGIRESLTSIPTMSIVMEHADLWGSSGIYNNATNRGTAWRRPASVEYFDPLTGQEFQYDVGVQMHGNASRDNVRLKKHSFRLLFREDYGPGSLNFPLFEDTDNDRFNTLVLRAHFTDAFATRTATNRYSPMDSLYMRDVWMRNTQLAMGSLSSHSTYVHLYINGLYWGLYNPAERPDDAFMAQYLGGEREDWDIVKDFNELDSGNKTAWNDLFRIARSLNSAGDPERIYQELQGNHADGTPDPDTAALLDIDNLIDFMVLHFYAGVEDWPHHNWYAARNRVDSGSGFQFYVWDQEIALDGRFRDLTGVGTSGNHQYTPAELYHLLRTNVDSFNLRFADRVAYHFAEGGALSLAENQARWDRQAAEIEAAIIGESARWGDAREGERIAVDSGQPSIIVPTLTIDHWRQEVANVRDNYMPRAHTEGLDNFRDAGLLTPMAAPDFSPPEGIITSGTDVTMAVRLTDGLEMTLVATEASAQALVPRDGSLDATSPNSVPVWVEPEFNDSDWIGGTGGVGYELGAGNGNVIGIDLMSEDLALDRRIDQDGDGVPDASSFYSRFQFTIDPSLDLDTVEGLLLRMTFDDGFVAYLNGTRIASENAPDPLTWDSIATRSSEANKVVEYNVTTSLGLLRSGANVLAIQGINRTVNSSDLLVSPELIAVVRQDDVTVDVYYTVDGTDPRAADGSIRESAMLLADGISIAETTIVTARGFEQGQWGAIRSATYIVNPAGPENLVVSEVNYHPHDPTLTEVQAVPDVESDDFEFIEIHNTSSADSVSVSGLSFSDGVRFDFPDVSLAPNSYGVVVANLAAFRLRYGDEVPVLGQWTGSLANGGEQVTLSDIDGNEYLAVAYNDRDPWPEAADGIGATLQQATSAGSDSRADKHYHWRASTEFGGSPGRAGMAALPLRINEVLSRPDARVGQTSDAIELYNRSTVPVDVGGWYLSDSADNLLKFQIPAATIVPGGGYVVFTEADFNPTPANPAPNHFALSGTNGDDVWLVAADGLSGVDAFVDEVHFPAARWGESFGRVDTSSGLSRLAPMTETTLGSKNAKPRIGSVVISEIHYHPAPPSAAALALYPELTSQDLEYLELLNSASTPIDLNGWRLRGGVDWNSESAQLGPRETALVISFDPDLADNVGRLMAFRAEYDVQAETVLLGGFSGQLSNSDDRITLLQYDATLDSHVIEDEVLYDDLSPWPIEADGQGNALTRVSVSSYGNEAASWRADLPSPGQMSAVDPDWNGDGVTNADDIDMLCRAIGTDDQRFDLNGDLVITTEDVSFLLDNVLRVGVGDANLDGTFDSADFVLVFQAGQYEDAVLANSGWATGDWNCDQEFNSLDMVVAFQAGTYRAAEAAIPGTREGDASGFPSRSALGAARWWTDTSGNSQDSHDLFEIRPRLGYHHQRSELTSQPVADRTRADWSRIRDGQQSMCRPKNVDAVIGADDFDLGEFLFDVKHRWGSERPRDDTELAWAP